VGHQRRGDSEGASVSRDPYPPGSLVFCAGLDAVPVSAWRDLFNYKEELRLAAKKVVRLQTTEEYAAGDRGTR